MPVKRANFFFSLLLQLEVQMAVAFPADSVKKVGNQRRQGAVVGTLALGKPRLKFEINQTK